MELDTLHPPVLPSRLALETVNWPSQSSGIPAVVFCARMLFVSDIVLSYGRWTSAMTKQGAAAGNW